MKEIKIRHFFGVIILIFCSTFILSCDKTNDEKELLPQTVSLEKLTIKNLPTKTQYTLGESLNLDGLIIIGTYAGGAEKPIAIDIAKVDGFSSDKPSEKETLKVVIDGKNVTFDVSILPLRVKDGVLTEVLPGYAKLSLPSSILEISEGLFYNNQQIVTVSLNEGLKKIGNAAFAFSSIQNINFPSSLLEIGKDAFNQCAQLKEVDLSATHLTTIKKSTFFGNEKMTSLKLPSTLVSIESQAFLGSKSLTELVLPEGLSRLGNEAFRECGAQSVKLPNSICSFDQRAFYICRNLTTVTTYGSAPIKVQTDQSNKMEASCFEGCTMLTTFSFPLGIEEIGQGVIGKSKVNSLVIHAGIKSIDFGAFGWLEYLNTITLESAVPPVADMSLSVWQAFSPSLVSIKVPVSAVDKYKNTIGWMEYKKIISASNI